MTQQMRLKEEDGTGALQLKMQSLEGDGQLVLSTVAGEMLLTALCAHEGSQGGGSTASGWRPGAGFRSQ